MLDVATVADTCAVEDQTDLRPDDQNDTDLALCYLIPGTFHSYHPHFTPVFT